MRKTKEIDAGPMQDLSQLDSDFQVTGRKFEVYGYCKNCAWGIQATAKKQLFLNKIETNLLSSRCDIYDKIFHKERHCLKSASFRQ